ncbi:hypothetical protein [Streptomyces chattanoogensis]|uniref:hypothetical protein n=1 Tax=Streptomyces chattanoogensis TaxID=66876 RepID=UPI0036D0A925
MAKPTSPPAPGAPFKIGDHVRSMTYVPPEQLRQQQPELFEGDVVQIGSGYAGIDADRAFVWVRAADGTERKALISDTELWAPTEAGSAR